jgi:hypothetical protein
VASEPVSPIPGVRYVHPADVRAMSPGPALLHDPQYHHGHHDTFDDETHAQHDMERDHQHGNRGATEQEHIRQTHIQLPPARSRSYEAYVQGHSRPPEAAPDAPAPTPPATPHPRDGCRRDRHDDDSEAEVEAEVERRRRRKRVSFLDDDGDGGRRGKGGRVEGREGRRERGRRGERTSPSPDRRESGGKGGGRGGGRGAEGGRPECVMSGALPERTVWRWRVVHRWEDEGY